MAGQKRTRNGNPKPSSVNQQTSDATRSAIQPPPSNLNAVQPIPSSISNPIKPKASPTQPRGPSLQPRNPSHPIHRKPTKQLKLPPNVHILKRPLHHSAPPSPFSSSTSPKTLYIRANTPFIPAIKRLRGLLTEIKKREAQAATALAQNGNSNVRASVPGGVLCAQGLRADGHLNAADVERSVAAASQKRSVLNTTNESKEEVFLKATGRAIPRALELGVWAMATGEWRVKVEMGRMRTVDDLVVVGDGCGGEAREGGGEGMEVGDGENEVPETRIRTVGAVTVCVGWL